MTDLITVAQLRAIAGGRAPLAAKIAESFNPIAGAFAITTPMRLAQFLAQLSHESGGFTYVREIWGPTAAQKRYEGRKDLGNLQPGDGSRYRGRGPIQITGRANYAAFTAWIRRRYPEAPDFEAEPEKLETFPWALMAAFWFWDTRGLNALADADDVTAITRKINGGTNGLTDRKAALKRAKAALGVTAPAALPRPTPSVKPAPPRAAPAADAMPAFQIQAAQQRLIALGYHEVGLADGKAEPKFNTALRQLQQRAADLGERVTVDGIYGPQTSALLDAANGDRFRNLVSEARRSITAKDLAAVGTPAVVVGRRLQWGNVVSAASTVFGVLMLAVQNYQAGPDLPWWMSTALGFLPPWAALVAPAVVSLYSALAAKGLVGSAVERVREGIDNSGMPATSDTPPGWPFNLFVPKA